MTLKRGKRLGGAFLDLRELADDGPVLCIFRVREFHAPEKATGFDGLNLPVTADVLVCDGPRKGEVHLGEKFIGAITAPLRGVRNPKRDEAPRPAETAIGEEIVLRIKVLNKGKSNAGAVGDEPSDTEMAAAEAIHQGGAAWNVAPANGSAAAQEPVAAGGRPW